MCVTVSDNSITDKEANDVMETLANYGMDEVELVRKALAASTIKSMLDDIDRDFLRIVALVQKKGGG